MSSLAFFVGDASAFAASPVMPKNLPPYSDMMRGYGQRLVAARKALGMSARALADLLGVSPQRLSHWETEKHPPDITAMVALQRMRGVSLDWIYAGDPTGLKLPILQALVTAGAAADAPPELVKLRANFLSPGSQVTIHERQANAPV